MIGHWPNLFVVGAPKAGTTTICTGLERHGEVTSGKWKEPHYFSDVDSADRGTDYLPVVRDEDEYLGLFAHRGSRYLLDGSTSYLWDTNAAGRISAVRPDARIIVSVRDPVQRAFSHYLANVREGYEKRPFERALQDELGASPGTVPWRFAYVGCGDYRTQLPRFLERFDDCLVLVFEEAFRDADHLFTRIESFLGLEPGSLPPMSEPKNPYAVPRNRVAGQVFHSDRARTVARALFPGSVRQWARSRVLMPVSKPPLGSRAFELLGDFRHQQREAVASLVADPGWGTST